MTQEDKELLLKDLCARLPYGVKLSCRWKTPAPNGTYGMICTMDSFLLDQIYNVEDTDVPFDEFKPYLFPLSSLTEEQKKYISDRWGINEEFDFEIDPNWREYIVDSGDAVNFVDWLNENHFDYRWLIPKGFALDATDKNIY